MPQTTIETNVTMRQTENQNSNNLPQTSEEFLEKLSASSDADIVRELAALFFEIPDIAFFLGMETEKLATIINLHPDDALSIAYREGQLRTKIMLRFDSRRYALTGSPEATKVMFQHLAEQIKSEKYA